MNYIIEVINMIFEKINDEHNIGFEDFEAQRAIENFKKLYGKQMFEHIIEHLVNDSQKPCNMEESDAIMWLMINNITFQVEYKYGKLYILISGDII